MTRLTASIITLLILFTHASSEVQAQDNATDLSSYLSQADALRSTGRFGARYLRRVAAKHSDIYFILHELKRQARTVESPTATDRTAVNAQISTFCKLSESIIARGPQVTASIDVHLALPNLDKSTQELLSRLDEAIYVRMARGVINRYLGKGTFSGMYDGLLPHRAKVLSAFMTLFMEGSSNTDAIAERGLAAEGISQFGAKGHKPTLTRLRLIWKDVTQNAAIREHSMRTLAQLGDLGPLNEVASRHKAAIKTAREKTPPDYNVILPTCRALGYLYLTVGRPADAIRYYTAFANVVFGFPFPTKNKALLSLSSNVFYNYACAASRLKNTYLSLWALNQHFNYGGDNYKWAAQDGDLAWIAKNPEFNKLLESWRTVTLKPGAYKFKRETFEAELKAVLAPKAPAK